MIHIGLAAVLLVTPPIDQASVRDAALDAGYQAEYVGSAGPIAQAIHAAYDIPASVTVAQSILESNWGRSKLSTAELNYFGFKCVTPTSPGPIAVRCASYPTTECIPSPCHPVDAFFRSYASVFDSFRDYGRLLTTSSNYAAALPVRDDPDAFVRAVARKYATDPEYANKVIKLMDRYDLRRFDR
ncbi:glucosaminidase domain-containing protein [Amycolatopsis sp. OK19-0408]|uniref:Glucosaminidase domain-containing protein n=1 Tax=Amycolatopsis iheyensis TaxID=2945988 RepID=A0A9X2NBC6_9PSEU|nr:glucosaminidase domain-containing protein [Amycolatopsis iheyensis]MCR6481305.1 glucosaminidase domain-containing protein [Amycolatopsis iheyensis]